MKPSVGLRLILAVAVLAVSQLADAQTAQRQFDLICKAGNSADKEELANWLLDKPKLSARSWRTLSANTQTSREVVDQIFTGRACAQCSESDVKALRQVGESFHFVAEAAGLDLNRRTLFFSAGSTDDIRCSPALELAIEGSKRTDKPELVASPWRVRGSMSDLYIDQVTEKNAFKASKAGSISVQKDRVADTETHSTLVFVGRNFEIVDGGDRPGDTSVNSLSIIPFVGLDKRKVSTGEKFSAEDSIDKRTAGISTQLFRSDQKNWGYSANLIVMHSRDQVDRTRVNEITAEFEPIVTGRLNDQFERSGWWVYPKLRLLLDAVNFTGKSNRPELAAKQHDARRVGAELGVVIYAPNNKFSYTYNYRKLNDWKGDGDVSLFDQYLQFVPDERQYLALSLGYRRGYKEIGHDPIKQILLELQFRY